MPDIIYRHLVGEVRCSIDKYIQSYVALMLLPQALNLGRGLARQEFEERSQIQTHEHNDSSSLHRSSLSRVVLTEVRMMKLITIETMLTACKSRDRSPHSPAI